MITITPDEFMVANFQSPSINRADGEDPEGNKIVIMQSEYGDVFYVHDKPKDKPSKVRDVVMFSPQCQGERIFGFLAR